jgi:hypothetical protein
MRCRLRTASVLGKDLFYLEESRMDGGKFEMRDVPGMVPSQEEVLEIAERMARELYPEKFRNMISPEDFDRQMKAVCSETVFPPPRDFENDPIREGELREVPGGFALDRTHAGELTSLMGFPVRVVDKLTDDPNPLGRIATAEEANEMARKVVESAGTSPISRLFAAVRAVLNEARVFEFTTELDTEKLDELRAAYEALGLKDE